MLSRSQTDHTDRLIKRAELVEELARLNKLIEEHATKNSNLTKAIEVKKSELTIQTTKISVLSREVDNLKKEKKRIKEAENLSELVKMLGDKIDLGVNRKKADFEYELDGVDAFLDSNKVHYSKYFFAGSLAWYLEFKTKVDEEISFDLSACKELRWWQMVNQCNSRVLDFESVERPGWYEKMFYGVLTE